MLCFVLRGQKALPCKGGGVATSIATCCSLTVGVYLANALMYLAGTSSWANNDAPVLSGMILYAKPNRSPSLTLKETLFYFHGGVKPSAQQQQRVPRDE